MTGPPRAVAEIRSAVRAALGAAGVRTVLVACSGGADSVALAAATAFVAPRAGISAGLITVDHDLQEGSGERAEGVAGWARGIGLDPAIVMRVHVPEDGSGPEAAARTARYDALAAGARTHGAEAILLGHTMDDQAETVLLALSRGAGPRGLAGMPERREVAGIVLLRPLLAIRRSMAREAATVGLTEGDSQRPSAAGDLAIWDDPHNVDERYARARVRRDALPALVAALGDGVVSSLAQTAAQLADDVSYLDAVAARALPDAGGLRVVDVETLHPAIRSRVLHGFALRAGATPGALSHRHVEAIDALVTRWHGQGPIWLPGGATVARVGGWLMSDGGKMPR